MSAVENQRAAGHISHFALCSSASVHPATWFYLRHGAQAPRPDTLERLERAIAELTTAAAPRRQVDIVAAFVRAAEAMLRGEIGKRQRIKRAIAPDYVLRRQPNFFEVRLRQVAIYLAAVELEVGNADIARALGTTRQNVHKVRHTVEQMRDSKMVDALLERCRALLKGEGT